MNSDYGLEKNHKILIIDALQNLTKRNASDNLIEEDL